MRTELINQIIISNIDFNKQGVIKTRSRKLFRLMMNVFKF